MGYFLPSVLKSLNIDNPNVFVETGTYLGGSAQRFLDTYNSLFYERVITVEIDKENASIAASRFKEYERGQRNYHSKEITTEVHNVNKFFNKRLELWVGDTKDVLPIILTKIYRQAIFWLDAHSGREAFGTGEEEVPLHFEIEQILQNPLNHYIAIDDVHLFGKKTAGADYSHISIDKIKEIASKHGRTVHHISPFYMEMLVIV